MIRETDSESSQAHSDAPARNYGDCLQRRIDDLTQTFRELNTALAELAEANKRLAATARSSLRDDDS